MFGRSSTLPTRATSTADAPLSPCSYSSGQPVHGSLVVSLGSTQETGPLSIPAQTEEVIFVAGFHFETSVCGPALPNCSSSQIYGSAQFFFSQDLLQTLYSSPGIGSVRVTAHVTDSSTGTRCFQPESRPTPQSCDLLSPKVSR